MAATGDPSRAVFHETEANQFLGVQHTPPYVGQDPQSPVLGGIQSACLYLPDKPLWAFMSFQCFHCFFYLI